MSALVRTGVGTFEVGDTVAPDDLTVETLECHLLNPMLALADLRGVTLTAEQVQVVRRGQFVELENQSDARELVALDESERLVAILVPRGNNRWGASKNFVATD